MTENKIQPQHIIAVFGVFLLGWFLGIGAGANLLDSDDIDDSKYETTLTSPVDSEYNISCVKEVIGNRTTFELSKTWAISVNTGERNGPINMLTVHNRNLSDEKISRLFGCAQSSSDMDTETS